MDLFKEKFERVEQKYLLNTEQYRAVLGDIGKMTLPDEYGQSRICNVYYDTPDWQIIRRSIEKPDYKEKLRLRCYGEPDSGSTAFVEIKKKYKGIVYKRRVAMTYSEASTYLSGESQVQKASQITREIDYFIGHYKGLHPAMLISYNRTAFYTSDGSGFRVTFDSDIIWRTNDLDMTKSIEGSRLLTPGVYLMEIKIPCAMPLWMSHILDKYRVYPTSFSKYGKAYCEMISKPVSKDMHSAILCRSTKNNKEGELSA